MPGYKMKNGSKNYMIKSYEKGGLVETKSYKDGKLVIAMAPVTEDSLYKDKNVQDFVAKYGEAETQAVIDSFKEGRFKPEENLERELKVKKIRDKYKAKDAEPK